MYKYVKELSEDRVFSIGNFGVASNVESYKTTRHPYKINFQYGTTIKQCDDKFVPASIYVIGDPREIFQSQYDTDYLIGKLFFDVCLTFIFLVFFLLRHVTLLINILLLSLPEKNKYESI